MIFGHNSRNAEKHYHRHLYIVFCIQLIINFEIIFTKLLNMKKTFFVLLLFLAIMTQAVFAQTRTVTGTIKDDSGEILPGVSVIVIGTTVGTVTSSDGQFTLSNVSPTSKLKFSFIGMK